MVLRKAAVELFGYMGLYRRGLKTYIGRVYSKCSYNPLIMSVHGDLIIEVMYTGKHDVIMRD